DQDAVISGSELGLWLVHVFQRFFLLAHRTDDDSHREHAVILLLLIEESGLQIVRFESQSPARAEVVVHTTPGQPPEAAAGFSKELVVARTHLAAHSGVAEHRFAEGSKALRFPVGKLHPEEIVVKLGIHVECGAVTVETKRRTNGKGSRHSSRNLRG